MKKIAACLLLAALAAGCNPVPPLSVADKAKFIYELIENQRNCDVYRTRLNVPAVDGPTVDAIYREATQRGCIKRDV